jgi:hypothetical protein
MELPPPTDLSRQTGIGSPITLSRGTSTGSDEIRSPEEEMRSKLLVYKTYLEHETDFLDKEITALLNQGEWGLVLRTRLKVRYNTVQRRLHCVVQLLDAL